MCEELGTGALERLPFEETGQKERSWGLAEWMRYEGLRRLIKEREVGSPRESELRLCLALLCVRLPLKL